MATASARPRSPCHLPTATAADLFVLCDDVVKAADWAEAVTACEKVSERDAEHPGLGDALATTYVALGKEELARDGTVAGASTTT